MNPNTVVAKVNGQSVTNADLDREIGMMLQRNSNTPLPPDAVDQMRPTLQAQALEQIVLKCQLEAYAESSGVVIPDGSIDSEIASLKTRFPNEQGFEQALSSQGLTVGQLRLQMKKEMTLAKGVEHYLKGVPVPTDEAMQAYYQENLANYGSGESVSACHILIGFTPEDSEADKATKRSKAQELRKQLTDGSDFAALAKEHSTCPSGQRGGDLGAFPRGKMVPAFEEAAFALTPGEISEVVETQFGYHLIRVTEHKQGTTFPFEEVKNQVEKNMGDAALEAWFKELVSQAKVERN